MLSLGLGNECYKDIWMTLLVYKFPEYFQYKDQLPPCSTWGWLTYLYNCLLAFFYVPGIILGTWDTVVNKQGVENPCPQDIYRASCSQVYVTFLFSLTSLLANILYMLMISEDLLTLLFLISLYNIIGFNYLLCVVVALNFISCYLWSLYHIPVPCVQVLAQVHLVISVSLHT